MSTTFARERTLQDEISPAVERSLPGVEVLAVELLSTSRLCVYVDAPDGVDHALCERVTRVLDSYRSEYTIDVSSPGPARPLRTRPHFLGVLGRRVAVRTGETIDGRDRFRGEVADAGEDSVALTLSGDDVVRIPYEAIVRANLVDEGLRS